MKFLHTLAKCSVLLTVLMLFSTAAMAQRTVKGKVSDAESGEPLIGASVSIVGTTRGTSTDVSGNYSLEVPNGATQLRVAYTGYAEQTITLGASNVQDVALKGSALLSEVVVVGYGSIRKTDATGAVTSVTEKDFNRGIVTSPEQLIQGRAAGVQIAGTSGEPGAGISIRIRGTSSVANGNNPLFVVDGVPLSGDDVSPAGQNAGFGDHSPRNPLNFLNPSDIVSVDVLKDASATAIYGSRGANGVVIITTKKGKEGKGSLDYDYTLGVSTIAKKYDLLDGPSFLSAYAKFHPDPAVVRAINGNVNNTDWQDQIFRTAMTHTHNLAFGAGDRGGSYRLSLGYQDQEGILKGSGLTKYTARFNANHNFINDRLHISTQFTATQVHDTNPPNSTNSGFEGEVIGAALKANPTDSVYHADGTFKQKSNSEPNPLAMIQLSRDLTNTLRAMGNIAAELDIVSGLSFKTVLGIDHSVSNRTAAYSRDLNVTSVFNNGRLFFDDKSSTDKLWENYFTYKKDMGSVNLNAIVGYSYQQFNSTYKGFDLTGFNTSSLDQMINNIAILDQAAGKPVKVLAHNSANTTDELQSYYGRLNLGFSEKYLFTATLRADGSTKFGGSNKYGYFPSFGFKWRLIQEDFCPKFFSDLGLRLGYGITGNQAIPHDRYLARQRYNDWNFNQAVPGGGGLSDVAFANPNLKWESTKQLNVGIDFGIIKGRLSGSIDFYDKRTTDLLIQATSAQPAPQPFFWANLPAIIVNQGAELFLNLTAVRSKDFNWNVIGNFAYNHNEVTNYSGNLNTGAINGQGLSGAFAERIANGQPLYAFFLRQFGGYDANGITIYPEGDVQKFIGKSPLPSVTAGLTNQFSFKGFDLNIFLNGQFGQYVYNNTANAYFTAGSLSNGRNVTKNVVGNGEANLNAPDVSTRFLENASFVRLQDVTLGYRVKLNSTAISSLRFFVTAQNLAVFTSYTGQDPEVNINKSLNGIPSAGIDYGTYPRARTFLVGGSISF
jgi:iron complex outermembrane receptor protein